MSHKRLVTVLRRSRIAYLAIGIAVVVYIVPASVAQTPRVVGLGKSAESAIEAAERLTRNEPSAGPRSGAREQSGVHLEVPIGKVWVSPGLVAGEHVYIRRATVKEGMAIVEVSTSPFVLEPDIAGKLIGRPDQPASW
jgi:hypothetical protein